MELLIATVLVALAGMAARIAGNDMQERRRIDQTIFATRVKLANQFNAFCGSGGAVAGAHEVRLMCVGGGN
jgi:hypothetical protein